MITVVIPKWDYQMIYGIDFMAHIETTAVNSQRNQSLPLRVVGIIHRECW